MPPQLSPKLKQKTADKWMSALTSHLHPGEVVWALARTNQFRPMLDALAVTNARVIAFASVDVATKGMKVAVDADDIARFDIHRKLGNSILQISSRTRGELAFGAIADAELDFVQHYVNYLATIGYAPEVRAAVDSARTRQRHDEQRRAHALEQVKTIGSALAQKEWDVVHSYSAPGEAPWLIINPGGGAGFLAAFSDRLIIAKVSGAASWMAGSLGGGRVTVVHYSDITNIEYNSGLVTGVLEVLTPSYQGTGNHDYWRSSGKGRNQASDDPWTLSNCLPLPKSVYKSALPQITELHRKIAENKRPNVSLQYPIPPTGGPVSTASGLASELKELAALHEQGVLDTAEFAAAKQSAIVRHQGLA